MKKIDRVIESIQSRITEGRLKPGQKLPSIRQAVDEFGVSKNTVIEAYERLSARGLIRSVHGAGFFVCASTPAPLSKATQPAHIVEAVDRLTLLTAQLDQEKLPVRVGDGRPPQSWMNDALPLRMKGNIFKNFVGDPSGYGGVSGHLQLRELIAARSNRADMSVHPDQIVTTFGANHALDLIIRRYLEPGDVVLVDDPGYYPLLGKFKLAKIRAIGVPRTPTGPDLDVMETLAAAHGPKMFFTQSTCQNPTGSSMSLPVAHGVLQVAQRFGLMVIDNDPFTDLPGNAGVPLSALDAFNSVIAISSFSKLLSASFRVGYVIARPEVARELTELKLLTVVNSSRFSEMVIAELIKSQRYSRHLNKLVNRLEEARRDYHRKVRKLGLDVFCAQETGYYSFLQLPHTVDEGQLVRKASAAGIMLAPGRLFAVDENPARPALRINVTRADDPRFYRFLKRQVIDGQV